MGGGYPLDVMPDCSDMNMLDDMYVFLVDGSDGEFIDYAACS